MNRRQFLKKAAVAAGGAALIPAIWGGGSYLTSEGSLPPEGSPFREQRATEPLPGAPLLVLTHSQPGNPFSAYTLEILRAEGLNAFEQADLSALSAELLARHDVVLLPEAVLTGGEAALLAEYVAAGGRLVVFRPDPLLAGLLGLTAAGLIEHGYLRPAAHPAAEGISPDFLKFHGLADAYPAAGLEPIAWLTARPEPAEEFPAVAAVAHGAGSAVIWAFDLTRSVILSRQGNPALANVPEPWDGLRAVNMFVDWFDIDRIEIPYVDEQQRLLANILNALAGQRRPLPRWWYFPGASPSLLIATSDCHSSSHKGLQELIDLVESFDGHLSVYYTPAPSTHLRRTLKRMIFTAGSVPVAGDLVMDRVLAPTPAMVRSWRAAGHEFGIHPYVDETSVTPGLVPGWQTYWQEFTGLGYGPVSPTARTHRIIWTGWIETARVQASYGIRMNMDYYHWGPLLRTTTGEWKFGYLTGSGLAMKFVDEQGRLLDIYQQLTQLADDHIVDLTWEGVMEVPYSEGLRYSRAVLERSVSRYPSAIACQFHADPFSIPGTSRENGRGFAEGTLSIAHELGIPIWSAEAWLDFVEQRQAARFSRLGWDGVKLSLSVEGNSGPYDLPLLLPLETAPGQPLVEVQVDGQAAPFVEKQVGGVRYGLVMVGPGGKAVTAEYGAG